MKPFLRSLAIMIIAQFIWQPSLTASPSAATPVTVIRPRNSLLLELPGSCYLGKQKRTVLSAQELKNPECQVTKSVDSQTGNLMELELTRDCRSMLDSLSETVRTEQRYFCSSRPKGSDSQQGKDRSKNTQVAITKDLNQCLLICRRSALDSVLFDSESQNSLPAWPVQGVCSVAEIPQNLVDLSRILCNEKFSMHYRDDKLGLIPHKDLLSSIPSVKFVTYNVNIGQSETFELWNGNNSLDSWLKPLQTCVTDSDCEYSGFAFNRGGAYPSGCKILSGGIPVRKGVSLSQLKASIPKGVPALLDDTVCFWEILRIDRPGLQCFAGQCVRKGTIEPAASSGSLFPR